MLKSENIEIKISNSNIKYYRNIICDSLVNNMIIVIKTENLPLGSHIKITGICDICNSERILEYKSYNTQTNNGANIFTCSRKCSIEKAKITNLEKYGVENVFQNEKIKEKSKETCLNKYGVENYRKTDEYNEKSKKTNLEKYGYEHPSSSNIIKEKVKLRNNELFGVDYPAQNILILEKMKKTNLEKYLVDNYSKTLSAKVKKKSNYFIKEKSKFERYGILLNSTNLSIDFQCKYCENIFKISKSFSYIRNINDELLCIYCNPILSNTSKKELELLSFIRNNYSGTILTNNRSIISNELDIYLPELEIAFEFNGLYWHSELHKGRNYHISKTNECLDKGINLIHIWEDDWDNKKDIVKSIILNKLGRSNKIFARRCEIKIVNNKDVREFLLNNHIQGFVGSKIKLGLYYENELVSLMTFGNLRKSLGQVSIIGSYELLRFCNKLNYTIVGGASKLFKHFLNNYDVKDVISYSDNSRGVGNLYQKLNFSFIQDSAPNYYYIVKNIRKHRFGYRKDKLVKEGFDANKTEVEIMNDNGYFRIFDSGSKKWIFKV